MKDVHIIHPDKREIQGRAGPERTYWWLVAESVFYLDRQLLQSEPTASSLVNHLPEYLASHCAVMSDFISEETGIGAHMQRYELMAHKAQPYPEDPLGARIPITIQVFTPKFGPPTAQEVAQQLARYPGESPRWSKNGLMAVGLLYGLRRLA